MSANPEAEEPELMTVVAELAHVPGRPGERRLPRIKDAREPSAPYVRAAVVLLLVAEAAWCVFLLTLGYRFFS